VFFVTPGVNFDLASFSFQVPICGSAAKDSTPPQKQNANVNTKAFVLMAPIEAEVRFAVNLFCMLIVSLRAQWISFSERLNTQRSTPKALKLARCPHSLIASLATLPSMSLIPFAPFASRQFNSEWNQSA
jgi:hypothetical protein